MVFFRFPPKGKVEKTRFERNWATFSTRLFALLGKAHSKWWYETDLVEFDPKGVFSFRPDGESRKNAFWTQLDDVRQPGFLPCFEKPTQNGGKVEKTRFERNWTTSTRLFVAQKWWLKRSQGCFFVSPRWEKSKKTRFERNWMKPGFLSAIRSQRVFAPKGKVEKTRLNGIGRRSSTRLFALLGKAHSKWWYETDLPLKMVVWNRPMKPWKSIPRVFFRFAPMGKVEKNAFWTQLDDVP